MPQPTTNTDMSATNSSNDTTRSVYSQSPQHDDHDDDDVEDRRQVTDEFVEYSEDDEEFNAIEVCDGDEYEEYEPVRSIPDIVTDGDFEGAIRSLPSTLTLTPASDCAVTQCTSWNNDDEGVTRSIDVARMNDDTEYFGVAAPVWVSSYNQVSQFDATEPLTSDSSSLSRANICLTFTGKPERSESDNEPGAAVTDDNTHQTQNELLYSASASTSTSTAALTVTASTQTSSSVISALDNSSSPRHRPILCRTHSVVLDDDDESRAFRSRQHATRASMNEEYTQARRTIQQLIDNSIAQHQLAATATH